MDSRQGDIDDLSVEEQIFLMEQNNSNQQKSQQNNKNTNEEAEADAQTVRIIYVKDSLGVKKQEIQLILKNSRQILTQANFIKIEDSIKEIESQILKIRDFEKVTKNTLKNIQINFLDETKIVDAYQSHPLISFSAELQKALPSVNLGFFQSLCPFFQQFIQHWKTTSNIQEIFKSFKLFIERGLTLQTPKSILFGIKPQDLKDIVQKCLPSISQHDNRYDNYCQLNNESQYQTIFQKIDSDFNTLQKTQFNIALEQFQMVSEKYSQLAQTHLEVVFSNRIKIIQNKIEETQSSFKQAKVEEKTEEDWTVLLQKAVFYKKTLLLIEECKNEIDLLEEQIHQSIFKSIDETTESIQKLNLQPIILFSEFFRELLKVVAEVMSPSIIEGAIKTLQKNASLQKSYARNTRLKFKNSIFEQNQNKPSQSAVKTAMKELCIQYKLSAYLPQIQELVEILPVWGSSLERHLKNEKPSETSNWSSILILQDMICMSLSEAGQQKVQDSFQFEHQQKEIHRIWQSFKSEVKEIKTMDLFQFEIVEDESQQLRVSRIENSEIKQLYLGQKITVFLCGEDISYELPDTNRQNQRCILQLSDEISFDLVKWLLCDCLSKEEREIILSLFIYFFDEKNSRKQLTFNNVVADFPQYARLAIQKIQQFKEFFNGQLQHYQFCSEVARISQDARRNVQLIQKDVDDLQRQSPYNCFQDYYDQSTNELASLLTRDSSGKAGLLVFDQSSNQNIQQYNGIQVIKKIEFESSFLQKIFKKLYGLAIFPSVNSETTKALFYFCQFLKSEDQIIQKKTNTNNSSSNNVVLINQETIINVQQFLSRTSDKIRKLKIEEDQKKEALRIEEEKRIAREKKEQEEKEKRNLEQQEKEKKKAEANREKEKLEENKRQQEQTKRQQEAEKKRLKEEEEQQKKDKKQQEDQRKKEEKLAKEYLKQSKKEEQTKFKTQILNTSKSGKIKQPTISSSSSLSENILANQSNKKGSKNQQEDYSSPLKSQTLSQQTSISENLSPIQNRENKECSQFEFLREHLDLIDAKINELQDDYQNNRDITNKIETLRLINKTAQLDLLQKATQEQAEKQQVDYVIKKYIQTKEVGNQENWSCKGAINDDIEFAEGNEGCCEDETDQKSQLIQKEENIVQSSIIKSIVAKVKQSFQNKNEAPKKQEIASIQSGKSILVQGQFFDESKLNSTNQAAQHQSQQTQQINQYPSTEQGWQMVKKKEKVVGQSYLNNKTTLQNNKGIDKFQKNGNVLTKQNSSNSGNTKPIQKKWER